MINILVQVCCVLSFINTKDWTRRSPELPIRDFSANINHVNCGHILSDYASLRSRSAVTAHFKSKQLLFFDFPWQNGASVCHPSWVSWAAAWHMCRWAVFIILVMAGGLDFNGAEGRYIWQNQGRVMPDPGGYHTDDWWWCSKYKYRWAISVLNANHITLSVM